MNKLIENRMHHVKECPKDLRKKKEDGEGEREEEEEKKLKKKSRFLLLTSQLKLQYCQISNRKITKFNYLKIL